MICFVNSLSSAQYFDTYDFKNTFSCYIHEGTGKVTHSKFFFLFSKGLPQMESVNNHSKWL